jgi:ABC-2 type transport system permease protein
MLRGFRNIVIKELKELVRDPKIIVGMIVLPLIMFPALGLVISYAQQSAIEQVQKSTLIIVNNDGGNWSQTFISHVQLLANPVVINNTDPQQVVNQGILTKYNSTAFIEIPPGFSQNITLHLNADLKITGTVNVYGVFQGGSIFSGLSATAIAGYASSFNRAVAPDLVTTAQSTVIKGQIQHGIDTSQLSSIMIAQSIALPITVMILMIYAMQIAATSVAMEKEEKTLETLLTLPVDRFAILMGKLSSTIIVGGVAAAAYMIGYNYMLSSATFGVQSGSSIDLVKLGLVPSPLGYGLLGLSLFVTLLCALALAVIMSAFSEDVRGAQALVAYMYPLIFIPCFALMYLDINTLPDVAKAILYAIPFSHPIIASKAVVMGNYATAVLGIIYVTVFTLVIMYVASRLFATERILTAKLKFRKKKKTLGAD